MNTFVNSVRRNAWNRKQPDELRTTEAVGSTGLATARSAHVPYPGDEHQTFLALDTASAKDGVGAIPLVPGQPSEHFLGARARPH